MRYQGHNFRTIPCTFIFNGRATGGGIIPDDDMKYLNKLGVGKLFPPGTPTTEIAEYIKGWVKANRDF